MFRKTSVWMAAFICLTAGLPAMSQQKQGTCVQPEMVERHSQEDPQWRHLWAESRWRLEKETSAYDGRQKMEMVYTIPVVVHVVHAGGAENVSDAKIQEAMDQVNADFAALNAANIHPDFQGLVADAHMEFQLAQCDPYGNPTSGITRTYAPGWSDCGSCDINMKKTLMWPQDKYLNVYVVKSSDGGNGSAFAYYPSQVEAPYQYYDGVVISSWAFGRTTVGYYSVLSHEIGHWANLIHTWGEGAYGRSNNCNTDDLVADTPNTIGHWDLNCGQNTVSCNSLDNNENFMDYGSCAEMFTFGQVNRMHAALNASTGKRNHIWSEANLAVTLACTGGGGNGPVELHQANLSGNRGEWLFFVLDVPEGMSRAQFSMGGGRGDADLYLRYGATPSEDQWDYRPYENGNEESVTVAHPAAGAWTIGIRGYRRFTGVNLDASAN